MRQQNEFAHVVYLRLVGDDNVDRGLPSPSKEMRLRVLSKDVRLPGHSQRSSLGDRYPLVSGDTSTGTWHGKDTLILLGKSRTNVTQKESLKLWLIVLRHPVFTNPKMSTSIRRLRWTNYLSFSLSISLFGHLPVLLPSLSSLSTY